MLTTSEMQAVLDRMRFPPGVTVKLIGNYGLEVMMEAPDANVPPRTIEGDTTAVRFSLEGERPIMFEDALLAYVRSAVHGMFSHEVDEWLMLDGKRLWDPHGGPSVLQRA